MKLKLFGKNAIVYMIGNVALRATSFLLIPLYTHSVSKSDYGLLAILLLTIQLMIVFMNLGTRNGFVRFAAEFERKNLIGRLLGSSILINIAGGIIVTGISVMFLLPFFRTVLHTDNVLEYIVLTCFAAMSQSLCIHIMSYYRAKNDGAKFMFAGISAAILLIIVNIVFLFLLHQGIRGVLMAQIIVYGGVWIFISFHVMLKTGTGISIQMISMLLRFCFPLVFAMTGSLITDSSAIYLISYFKSLDDVAIFSLGYKIAQISGIALILPFQLAYEPFVYANINRSGIRETISKLFTYLMLAFAFIAFGIVFISRGLLSVIAPPEYFPAYSVIFLILPGIAFRGVFYIGQSLLHIKNKSYITGIVVTLLTIFSVILNCLLIPRWGVYGAIFVFNVTLIFTALLLMILGMKAFPVPLEYKRLGIAGLLLISFLTIVFFFFKANPYIYYSLIPFAVFVSIILLCSRNFVDDQEKRHSKGIFFEIQKSMRSSRLLRGILG